MASYAPLSPAGLDAAARQKLLEFVEVALTSGPLSLAQLEARAHQRYPWFYTMPSIDYRGNSNETHQFLSKGADVIIRMRGLPYDCTALQILEFFARPTLQNRSDVLENGDSSESAEHSVSVMDGEEGILFVNKADGRATGDAFVLIATEKDAEKALAKHKEIIGTRYIELFRSTTAEVQQVINKSMEPPKLDSSASATPGLIGAVPAVPGLTGVLPASAGLFPQQLIISGSRKDCIRLRGLPYEAQVQNILDFLGEFAKHIVYQGVHMVYNAQGHPSGEAFIQMDGDSAAAATATERHNKYMQIGKKQRYIEVFQCSADDMNLVLTGPSANSPANPLAPGLMPGVSRAMMSPGGALFHGGLGSPGSMAGPNFGAAQMMNPQMLGMGAQMANGFLPAGSIPANLYAGGAPGGQRIPVIPVWQW